MDVDGELEATLLRAFNAMGTEDRDSLIAQFQRILTEGAIHATANNSTSLTTAAAAASGAPGAPGGGSGSGAFVPSEATCAFFLEMNNWSLPLSPPPPPSP